MKHPKRLASITISILAGALSRSAALLTQAICGLYLSSEQLGTFAACLGFLGLAAVLRSGGAAVVMPALAPSRFALDAPPQFWWSVIFLTTSGVILLGGAFWASELSNLMGGADPEVLRLILALFAFRQFCTPMSQLARAKLSVEHAFSSLAKIDSASAFIRLGLTIALAASGFGAVALALPYAAQPALDLCLTLATKRATPWALKWSRPDWRSQIKAMRWPIGIAIGQAMNQQLSLLAISSFTNVGLLGNFYFATQLAAQPLVLIPTALSNVIAPLAKAEQTSRGNATELMRSTLSGSLLMVPIFALGVASVFPSMELMVWGGKWSNLFYPICLLSVGVTYATSAALTSLVSTGENDFRSAALSELARGLFTIVLTCGTAIVLNSSTEHWTLNQEQQLIALTTTYSLGLVLASLPQLLRAAARAKVEARDFAQQLVFGLALSLLSAVAAASVGQSIRSSFVLPDGRLGSAVDFCIIGTTYLTIALLAARFTAEQTVRGLVALLPDRMTRRVNRLLRL